MTELNLFAISALVNGIVSITFGVLVVSKNWRDRMNQVFFLMTSALAVWSFAYWRWQLSTDYATALMWVKLLSASSLFIPIFFYHWVTILVEAKLRIHRIILTGAYVVTLAILPLVNTSLFITGLQHKEMFLFWPNSGLAYDVYFSYVYIGLILYSLYLLVRTYRLTDDSDKKGQILYVILGGVLGFGGGLTNFPLWWDIPILPFGNVLVAAFPFLLGYSVIKYKLFNMKTIIAEMFAFTLVVFMLIIVLLADSSILRLVYGVFFVLTSVFSALLVRSVYREVEQREHIQKLAEELKQINARQETLIHFVGHEVKGYLAKNMGVFAALEEGDMGELPEEAKPFISEALEQTRAGARSVMSILQASNLKKGNVSYHMAPLDFEELVKKTFAGAQQMAQGKGLTFTLSVDKAGEPYTLTGDADQLGEHVLRNLIENAVNYTPQGSVTVSLKKSTEGRVVFAVSDTGVGITDEDKARLFTEGGHGKDSIKVNAHSTGYGLFIAKQIIDTHHGTILAESAGANKGSRFIVELPVT